LNLLFVKRLIDILARLKYRYFLIFAKFKKQAKVSNNELI